MAISCGINNLNRNSFVECPTGSGLPARAVKICNPEDIGSGFPLPDGVASLNIFNEVTGVAISAETTILTYTVPTSRLASIAHIEVSGTNITKYRLKLNGTTIATRRTHFGGPPNSVFPFDRYEIVATDVLTITADNCGTDVADYESRVNGIVGVV